MKKASVENTPQVWKAWFSCPGAGYTTAASIMTHQPVKNWRAPASAKQRGPGPAHSCSGTSLFLYRPHAWKGRYFYVEFWMLENKK